MELAQVGDIQYFGAVIRRGVRTPVEHAEGGSRKARADANRRGRGAGLVSRFPRTKSELRVEEMARGKPTPPFVHESCRVWRTFLTKHLFSAQGLAPASRLSTLPKT